MNGETKANGKRDKCCKKVIRSSSKYGLHRDFTEKPNLDIRIGFECRKHVAGKRKPFVLNSTNELEQTLRRCSAEKPQKRTMNGQTLVDTYIHVIQRLFGQPTIQKARDEHVTQSGIEDLFKANQDEMQISQNQLQSSCKI